jgi:hypothetical protein
MKRFWSYIKHKRSDNNTIPPLKSAGTLNPDSTKSETTKEEFKDRCNMAGNFQTMPDIQITENGVAKLLHHLNPHKSAGQCNTKSLKRALIRSIINFDTYLKEIYDTGDVPNIWKTTFVCPIFKKRKKV